MEALAGANDDGMTNPCDAIELAVTRLIEGDRVGSLAALESIDRFALVRLRNETRARASTAIKASGLRDTPIPGRRPREPVPKRVIDATYTRDRYTCRYAHCGQRTIDLDVLKLISKVFPAVLPYQSNWRPVADHIVYWTLSTSLEHVVPFPLGGTSAPSNLVTACYLCNDTKNSYALDAIGWTLANPAVGEWQGLRDRLPELRRVVRTL